MKALDEYILMVLFLLVLAKETSFSCNKTKPKGVTTQMKALDEYFLIMVFTLLLNKLYVFLIFMFNSEQRNMAVKGFK